jgi:hypothetical protein
MKRIKLFMLSAAIVAAGSAFVSKPAPTSTEYVKDNGVWKVKSTVDGVTGSCIPLNNMHCTFVLRSGATQPYQDSDFTPIDANQAWQNF